MVSFFFFFVEKGFIYLVLCGTIGHFELSQPQRVTSGEKKKFSMSPSYSAHKSSNSEIHKTSPNTNPYKIKYTSTNIKQHFGRISPFGVAPIKKEQKARTCWYLEGRKKSVS